MDRDYINLFLNDLQQLCQKYDLSISHEDYMGGFIIENYDPYNIKWLSEAKVEAENRKREVSYF